MTRPHARSALVAEFGLADDQHLPLRTKFDYDPLSGIVGTLARADAQEEAVLQLLIRPRPSSWHRTAHARAQRLREGRHSGLWPLLPDPPPGKSTQVERARAKSMEAKAGSTGFDCVARLVVQGGAPGDARELVRSVNASLGTFGEANRLRLRRIRLARPVTETHGVRGFPLSGSFLMTVRELEALWHFPEVAMAHLETLRSPQIAAPLGAERGERVLGMSWSDTGERPVKLSVSDSRYHLHVLGSTGTGKTTVLLGLAGQDIAAGRGVGVLDPKGELVRGLLERIPAERIGDVVLISPEETGRSVGVNPLELWPGDDRDLVADNALTIFKRIYERYWGPRTDDILRSALLTLLRRPGSTLAEVPLLLTDAGFRRRALEGLADPIGLDGFWAWFEGLSESGRTEATGPVLNKLRDFLVRPRLRRLLCQVHSTVDLRDVVDSGKILLADLSVGRWGETTSELVGSFLVARLWQAVLARSPRREKERRDFFLFVDEFQHFLGVAGPFADVLAEARSLRLSLTLANQHLGQLTRDLREAVASNARSRVVFQCGQDDAAYLARELAPLDAGALMSLGRFEAACRLSIDGRSSEPFSLRTLLPPDPHGTAAAGEVTAAAMRSARPAEEIDRELVGAVGAVRPGPTEGARRRRA